MGPISRKINILFMLPNFDTGGSEKLVLDIIRQLDKTRFNPVLCVFFSGKYEKEYLKLGYPFYVINKDGIRSRISRIKFISDIVREHDIDLVNTHHTSPLIQGLIPFRVLNKVCWIHTEHVRLDLDPASSVIIRLAVRFCLIFVDIALGISKGVCENFSKKFGVKEDKIIKIVNGVDIVRFHFNNEKKNNLRARYRKDLMIGDEPVIGLFANFRRQKNHAALIKAAAILKQKGVNEFKVVFAGGGELEDECKELSKELNISGHIIFLGPRLDIPELMNMIDIYCLPSFFEGLPFSLIEAMAGGKAIVATDVIGNNEVVRHNQNAVMAPPDSPNELTDALYNVIVDKQLSTRIAQRALKDVEKFSFHTMIRKYDNLFTSLVVKHNRDEIGLE